MLDGGGGGGIRAVEQSIVRTQLFLSLIQLYPFFSPHALDSINRVHCSASTRVQTILSSRRSGASRRAGCRSLGFSVTLKGHACSSYAVCL